jgi:hypothetical protein
MNVTKLFTIQSCFKTDTFPFSFNAESEIIKARDISPTTSDSGSDCAEPYGGAPATKVFHRGQLHIHKAYTGPEPVAYVDTGLYEGGQHE